MSDPFDTDFVSLTSPAISHYAVVPSDTDALPVRPRAIYVDASGSAVFEDQSGNAVTYQVVAGMVLSLRPTRVPATGTTARLIAWY